MVALFSAVEHGLGRNTSAMFNLRFHSFTFDDFLGVVYITTLIRRYQVRHGYDLRILSVPERR
jgi:hypothetical protein